MMTPEQKLQCALTWMSVQHKAYFGLGGHRTWSSGDYIYKVQQGGQINRILGMHKDANEWIPVSDFKLKGRP